MVTFLLLFTNRKSFQSISFSLWGKQGYGEVPCPPPWLSRGHNHLLHECLDLVLQVLGQLWASPAWSRGQEAETVDGAELPLHLPAHLEQPVHREGRVSQRRGPGEHVVPLLLH